MKKDFGFIVIAFLSIFSLTSCNAVSQSSIGLEKKDETFALYSLNANAKKASLSQGAKDSYMYFAFDEDFSFFLKQHNESPLALAIDLSFTEEKNSSSAPPQTPVNLAFGFLTSEDFESTHKLKKGSLVSRSMISGLLNPEEYTKGISLSFALPASREKNIKGFFIYSTESLKLNSAKIQSPSLGWSFANESAFFAFSSMGGIIPSNLKTAQDEGLSLALISSLGLDKNESYFLFSFFPQNELDKAENYPSVEIDFGKERYSIRRSPIQDHAHLYKSQIDTTSEYLNIVSNKNLVTEILYKSNEGLSKKIQNEKSLIPLHTDPGMIIIWDKNTWRQDEYELFSWELFPSVLIMDFKNYKIQDDYLKRLAFFAEKKGYVGQLQPDAIIKNQHGFNAHDYPAQTLADFFALADAENFPLNKSELHLRSILLENGILKFDKGKLVEGEGALLSISQESYLSLRYTFMGHEAYHGIYFTEKAFRDYNEQVFIASDPLSRDFLIGYFTTSESLNYDIDNEYLLKNEFMAYHLQQSIGNAGQYFVNIASRPTVRKDLPELSKYVRDTKGRGFTEASRELDAFIYQKYGLSAGRVSLVSKTIK